MIHVVSVRVGTKYTPEYVAILHDMIGRQPVQRRRRETFGV